MVLNVYVLLFIKQHYPARVSSLQQLCAWLKKRAQRERKKSALCYEKRLISPFFNPSYSAFICIEIPHLCIEVHSTVNPTCCMALGIGFGGWSPWIPRKTHQILVLVVQTCCIFSTLARKWKDTNGTNFRGKKVSLWPSTDLVLFNEATLSSCYAVNSLPSSNNEFCAGIVWFLFVCLF